MKEELFTSEEIDEIIEEAKDPTYSEPDMAHPGFYKTAIIGVSRANGLILANGNEWTSYIHRRLRLAGLLAFLMFHRAASY